ncbi:MAG: hypothetical protein LUD29_03265 [Clostridia bacterium]|nr:hypothetical protein [Clostridia bacterium]
MFAGKSRKLKRKIIEEANDLKLDLRNNSSMSPNAQVAIQGLIDDLDAATFIKVKDKQLTLKNFQSLFNDIVSACRSGNENTAVYTCKIFRDNLKKMTGTTSINKRKYTTEYTPEQLADLVIQRLQGAQENYAKESDRLNKEKEKYAEKLMEDGKNPAIAAKYQTVCADISALEKKIKSVMDQMTLYNNQKIRKALIEAMKEFTDVEVAVLEDKETSDEQLQLITNKFKEAQDGAKDYIETTGTAEDVFNGSLVSDGKISQGKSTDYAGQMLDGGNGVDYASMYLGDSPTATAGSAKNDELFKNVEKVRDGYNLEVMYYKYKIQDASEEKDALVKEVRELLEKRDGASDVERATMDGDIRAKNNQVDALTQSIKKYQSAQSIATQKAGAAQRVITEVDISKAQSYNSFAKEFEANLQEYAMELSRRAEQRNVEAGDLAAIMEIMDSVQPDFEMGLSGSPAAEAEDKNNAEFEEMKKKYGIEH